MFIDYDNFAKMKKLETLLDLCNETELEFGSAIIYEEETGNMIVDVAKGESISEKFKHLALLCEKSIPDYYVTSVRVNKYNNIIIYVKG